MKNTLTEIVFIIDKSGSMYNLVDDTIGGFNGFVKSQSAIDGKAVLTTVLFSSDRKKLYDCVDLHAVEPLTAKQYVVGGSTAMLDAIGETIEEVQKRHDDTPEAERPGQVLCVITTDGQENASTKYKKFQVQKMIEHQTKGHGWQFIFLGANMDAVQEAADIGITYSATYTADSYGTKSVYNAVNIATTSLRGCGEITPDWDSVFIGSTNSSEKTHSKLMS